MSALAVSALNVHYGSVHAVCNLTVELAAGQILVALGPSGCGKSTLLRAIAGLERPTSGSIVLGGRDLTHVPPDRRGVGLMFQDNALFPHRSVSDNVAFGPRMQGLPTLDVNRRVDESLALVDLSGFGKRRVDELSGGEQQRVALARAIAPRPTLLMLDEPLGALDRALRTHLLEELPDLLRKVGTTVIYVTHDQDEALTIADRIAVMRAGRIEQIGAPEQLWNGPETEFVAKFIGLRHVVNVTWAGNKIRTPYGSFDARQSASSVAHGEPAKLALLAHALDLAPTTRSSAAHTRSANSHTMTGIIAQRRLATDHVAVDVALDAGSQVRVPVWRGPVPVVGTPVTVALDLSAARLVRRSCGISE